MRQDFRQFIFRDYRFDSKTGQLELEYSLDDKIAFLEKLSFPTEGILEDIDEAELEAALFALFMVAGVSYWKTFCPGEMVLEKGELSREQANFLSAIYTKGLGEFYYKNQIDWRGLVNFPVTESRKTRKGNEKREKKEKVLVPFGGGKDSAVVAELVKKSGREFGLITLRSFPAVSSFAREIGTDHLVIERQLAPEFFRMQKTPVGAQNSVPLQGHVPFTAITSFVSAVAAVLYGYGDIAFSSERTASETDLEYLGLPVNHQWSKSLEAEQLFSSYISGFISPNMHYFSLLRPFSELKVAQLFSQHKQYFSHFASCNSNFLFGHETKKPNWCCACAKCLFVFVMLAPWLSTGELEKIFGKNLLEDEGQLPELKNLLGVGEGKPFECVGPPEEVSAALYLASQKEEFSKTALVKYFLKEILPSIEDPDALVEKTLAFHDDHLVPEDYLPTIS